MVSSSSTDGWFFRGFQKVSGKVKYPFRSKSRSRSNDALSGSRQTLNAGLKVSPGAQPSDQRAQTSSQAAVVPPAVLTAAADDGISSQSNNSVSGLQQAQLGSPGNQAPPDTDASDTTVPSDLWTVAYREAIDSLGEELDLAILKAGSAALLFEQLEELGKEATEASAFQRGVRYLRSIQVPLERFKLAIDIAAPLSTLDPTATTVVGVVRGVTAVAITFATADADFAKQIGKMLEQMPYIDECDTLGQKSNKPNIHLALVSVYRKILEFYQAAYEILTKKGRKLVISMVLDTSRLPDIVKEFLEQAAILQKTIENTTLEIAQDIQKMLRDTQIVEWLGNGLVARQGKYHANLLEVCSEEACGFLPVHPSFADWYGADGSQQLLILGGMGSGKSVTMAFLADELSRKNIHQLPRPRICYYYCRGDETGQAHCLFSTLILAILEQFPGLKKTFCEWYTEHQESGRLVPATSTRKLSEFLEMVLEPLDRPLFILIDGLDECDRESLRTLLQLLKSLTEKNPRLKIVLSTRPEEEILEQLDDAFSNSFKISIESNTRRDEAIVRYTVNRKLAHLPKDVKEIVIKKLSTHAQGSAIWTRMIVESIITRNIRAPKPMRRFLESMPLPANLSKLYSDLLSRSSAEDPENLKLAGLALKLVAAAYRPLSIQELAWAVALGSAQHEISSVAALEDLVDHQRLMSLIQPFMIQLDFTDLRKRQVQFVHVSVREFVLAESALLQGPASTDVAANQGTSQALSAERLHTLMLDICIRYLLLDEIGNRPLFTEEQLAINALPESVDLFSDQCSADSNSYSTWEKFEEDMIRFDPTDRGFGEFFVYAASNWVNHFGAIGISGPLPSLENTENLCQAGSTRIHNWIEQNCRPDCVMKQRFEFDSSLYDPLSITSLYGSEAILRDMLENSTFDSRHYSRSTAMNAAYQILRWGDITRLRILFSEGKLTQHLQNIDFFRLLVTQWTEVRVRHDNWESAFGLVDLVLEKMVGEQWGNDLLCIAARAGCMPMIQHLIEQSQKSPELKRELLRSSRPIEDAIVGNHAAVVEFFIGSDGFGGYLKHINSRGENLLHVASGRCNPAIFRLLVPHLRELIQQIDGQGDTALIRVIKSGAEPKNQYESARILLSEVDETAKNGIGDGQQDPLQVATQLGDTEMCRLLVLGRKIDPLCQN